MMAQRGFNSAAVLDYKTSKRALIDLRNEDPSAYIAVAGLSSSSVDSERSSVRGGPGEPNDGAGIGDVEVQEIDLDGLGAIAESSFNEGSFLGSSTFMMTNLQDSRISAISMNESMLVSMNEASSMSLNGLSKEEPSPFSLDDAGEDEFHQDAPDLESSVQMLTQQRQRSARRVSFMEEEKAEEASSTDP